MPVKAASEEQVKGELDALKSFVFDAKKFHHDSI
jgi:hypothetical protein